VQETVASILLCVGLNDAVVNFNVAHEHLWTDNLSFFVKWTFLIIDHVSSAIIVLYKIQFIH